MQDIFRIVNVSNVSLTLCLADEIVFGNKKSFKLFTPHGLRFGQANCVLFAFIFLNKPSTADMQEVRREINICWLYALPS